MLLEELHLGCLRSRSSVSCSDIKSALPANHGKVICCRADEVGIFSKDYDDQHFVLEPGDGNLLGSFRLCSPSEGRVIMAQVKPNTV